MLVFVIIFNFLLTCLNLYLAFSLWRLRRVFVRVTAILARVESRIQRIFYPAPAIIFQGQEGTRQLGQAYQKLRQQLENLQPIILLVRLGIRVWRRQLRRKDQTYPQAK